MQQQIITIYKLENDITSTPAKFYAIGELNQFESAILRRDYCGSGSFEIWAPITSENKLYFTPPADQSKTFIYFGKNVAGIVECVQSEVDNQNHLRYHITGRTCEALLYDRAFGLIRKIGNYYILVNTTTFNGLTAEQVVTKMVKDTHTNTPDEYGYRKIPFFAAPAFADNLPATEFSFQRSGGSLYDGIIDFLSQDSVNLGFWVKFDPAQKKLIPYVYAGVDRSASQSVNDTVVFSDQLDDILQSQYIYDDTDYKNAAYVAGEGEGSDRTIIQVTRGASNYARNWYNRVGMSPGFAWRELYVDARDVTRKSQDTITDSAEEPTTLTDNEYFSALFRRGMQRLGECNQISTFNAKIRTHGNRMYNFGVNYDLGDIITVEDTRLGISVDTRVTESEETFGADYSLTLTFGRSRRTIGQKLSQIQDNMTN